MLTYFARRNLFSNVFINTCVALLDKLITHLHNIFIKQLDINHSYFRTCANNVLFIGLVIFKQKNDILKLYF